MADASGSTAWTYDKRGRMLTETKTIDGSGTYSTTWAYNTADLPISMTYPGDGETVAFDYNERMLLEKLRDTKNTQANPADDSFYVTSTGFDPAGRITSRGLGSGLTQAFTYYDWDEKASLDSQQVGQGGRLKNITAGALQNLNYLYDATGNLRQVTNTTAGETNAYSYDALNRLTSWTLNGTPESYTYDPVTGNLASKAGVALQYNHASARRSISLHEAGVGTDTRL